MSSPDYSSEIIDIYNNDSAQIIQILNHIQKHHGYLPRSELYTVSEKLNLPLSKIWGILTFYSHYKTQPPADYTVRICTGTACHVKNSKMLRKKFEEEIDTPDDNLYSTENVACLGCCALAPVFEINGKVRGKLNTQKVKGIAREIKGEKNE